MRKYNRSKWDREKSALLSSQQELLIEQAMIMMHTRPSYDRTKGELTVAGFKVKFTLGADSEVIMRKLFWGGKPVKYPVESGELKLALGIFGSDKRRNNKAFYRKVDYINMTISKQTGIAKFLVVSNRKVWFNPDHQDLYP